MTTRYRIEVEAQEMMQKMFDSRFGNPRHHGKAPEHVSGSVQDALEDVNKAIQI